MTGAMIRAAAILAATLPMGAQARLGETNATQEPAQVPASEDIGVPEAESSLPPEVIAAATAAAAAAERVGAVVEEFQPTTFMQDMDTLAKDFGKAEASLLASAFVKGGKARSLDYWHNASILSAVQVDAGMLQGHQYLATTTQYADTCCASCGSVDTSALVAGTDYYAVASAQAMQNVFASGGCCWCGQSSGGSGTAPMGCANCAKGRFLRKLPYAAPVNGGGDLFNREFNIVVADICPHQGNEAWCPPAEGTTNRFGSKNHFDFAHPPPGFDNYYFAFTPAPCSPEIEQRLNRMSQCRR